MNFLVSKLDIVDMLINIDCKDDMVKMDDLVDACNKLPTVNCDTCVYGWCPDDDKCEEYEAMKNLPSAESNADQRIQRIESVELISKQEAIDALKLFGAEHNAIAVIKGLPSAEPKTGRCETCKRNADNGGFYDDGRTRCPIQEHYVLLKDGYCHLYELRMRGEEE